MGGAADMSSLVGLAASGQSPFGSRGCRRGGDHDGGQRGRRSGVGVGVAVGVAPQGRHQ